MVGLRSSSLSMGQSTPSTSAGPRAQQRLRMHTFHSIHRAWCWPVSMLQRGLHLPLTGWKWVGALRLPGAQTGVWLKEAQCCHFWPGLSQCDTLTLPPLLPHIRQDSPPPQLPTPGEQGFRVARWPHYWSRRWCPSCPLLHVTLGKCTALFRPRFFTCAQEAGQMPLHRSQVYLRT